MRQVRALGEARRAVEGSVGSRGKMVADARADSRARGRSGHVRSELAVAVRRGEAPAGERIRH